MLGNIYKGKISKILKSFDIAFVDIGEKPFPIMKLNGKRYSEGEEIICQFIKLPIEDKGGEVTENISVANQFVAIVKSDSFCVKLSNKILNNKECLIKLLNDTFNGNFTIIIRTESQDKDDNFILNQCKEILNTFKEIIEKGIYKPLGFLLYDNKRESEVFEGKATFMLNCGGNIIIEKTSAFISVDVNSKNANCIDKKEELAYIINKEAINLLFEKMKTLNLFGIIIIDLLKLNKSEDINRLNEYAENLANLDDAETNVYKINKKLGLLEITRGTNR